LEMTSLLDRSNIIDASKHFVRRPVVSPEGGWEAMGVTTHETAKTRALILTVGTQKLVSDYANGVLRDGIACLLKDKGFKGDVNTHLDDATGCLQLWQPKQEIEDSYPKVLVGLVGRRRAGKDTVACILNKEGFYTVKFAEGLKIMLGSLLKALDFSDKNIERMIESDLKEVPLPILAGKSPRHAMQTLGTEWGRNCMGENIWVDIALERCKQFQKAVIADCRFPNEAEAIRKAGGLLIRVTRDTGHVDSHPSETLIDNLPVDFEVDNNGTVEELEQKIKQIL